MISAFYGTTSDNPVARALQRTLDDRSAAARAWLETVEPEEVERRLQGEQDQLPVPLSALLWAVARSAGAPLARALELVIWRISVEGCRTLAFGKVKFV
ncbi:MAG: hypothetical protein AAF581_15720 [Planctomycetota bacterium]